MALKNLIQKVLPEFPNVHGNTEVSVLQEIPVETLFFALKESDVETSLWFFENAKIEQVQGLIDLDCWMGDQFQPERFQNYFEILTQLTPKKLHDYSKHLDPEVFIRALMETCQVIDFDAEEPPDIEESRLILSPDSLYAVILTEENPNIREQILQWLNKLYTMDVDLARRHLESCKWEQKSDLEEFAYRIKKGRLEELGFVDREDALALFAVGSAPELKQSLLAHPLKKEYKRELSVYEEPVNEELLPEPISQELFQENFFTRALSNVEENKLRETLGMETIRSVNAFLMAEELMHSGVDLIKEGAQKARRYLDLGLMYLADGKIEQGTQLLEVQPLFQVLRLGWLLSQDLVKVALDLEQTCVPFIHRPEDLKLLQLLKGRHPQIQQDTLRELEVESSEFLSLESISKIATRLGEIAQISHFFQNDLKQTLDYEKNPFSEEDSAYTRLMTGLFRQSSSHEFSCQSIGESEWGEMAKSFSLEKFSSILQLILKRAPNLAKGLIEKRLKSDAEEMENYLVANDYEYPQKKYFKIVLLED